VPCATLIKKVILQFPGLNGHVGHINPNVKFEYNYYRDVKRSEKLLPSLQLVHDSFGEMINTTVKTKQQRPSRDS